MMRAQDVATKVAQILGGSAHVTSTWNPLEGLLRVLVPRHVPAAQRAEIRRIIAMDLDPAVLVVTVDAAPAPGTTKVEANRIAGSPVYEEMYVEPEVPSLNPPARDARVWQAGDWPGGPSRTPTNEEFERFARHAEEHGKRVFPRGEPRSSNLRIAPAELPTLALGETPPSMTAYEFRRGTSYLVVAHAGSNPNPRHDQIADLREHLGTVCDQVARNGADVAGMIIAGEASIEVKATPGDLTAMNPARRRQHVVAHRAAAADVIPGLIAAHVRRIAGSFRSIGDALACEHCPDIVAPLSFEALGAFTVLKSSWPIAPRTDEEMDLFCECLESVADEIKMLVLGAVQQSKASSS